MFEETSWGIGWEWVPKRRSHQQEEWPAPYPTIKDPFFPSMHTAHHKFSGPARSDSATPWTAARQASLSLTTSQSLPKFTFIASVMPSSHHILWCPLLLLPSVFPSIRYFSNELSVHIRWPKYWSFSFSSSSEYSELISLKIDCFDLLDVQGTFRSLLQHHSSKTSILWLSAFFTDIHPTICKIDKLIKTYFRVQSSLLNILS